MVKKANIQLHPCIGLDSLVGPPLDKEDFDLAAYNAILKQSNIPPLPDMKPIPPAIMTSSDSPRNSGLPNAPPSASVSPPAAPAPSPAGRILGPTPWKTYQQDPNRPSEEDYEHDDVRISAEIANAMSRLEVKDITWRFHGKASGAHLMHVITELKYGAGSTHLLDVVAQTKRDEYWKIPEWELVIAQEGVFPIDWSTWPAPGLDRVLIDAYFAHVNCHLPLLNKILFDRQYDSGLYRTNSEFAKICWMIFANGARFVDDDRVYWPRDDAPTPEGRERLRTDADGTRRYSAGWKYMRALIKMGRSIVATPNLYDFQTQVLLCAFLSGSAVPHMTWLVSGYGLRSAQELGIHVRATLLRADPVERALFGRAFWCLYHIDRTNCAAIGRSVALQDTDFDADYPIAVDDEFWETGHFTTDFIQPPSNGLPKVSAFIHTLKLDHVIGAALRTIYAVNKSPEHPGDPAAQRDIVVELDSALNSWADAVPDGLRWDPTRSDQQLFQQSAVLYAQYYYVQILIHRPFIPTPRFPNTVGLPSLAICSNAARSICNILDASLRRGRQYGLLPGHILDFSFILPAWMAAVILLVSIYSGKQQPGERERMLKDVKKCLAAMKDLELTWRQAGKLTDMLTELLREGEPVSVQALPQGQKRPLSTYQAATQATGHGRDIGGSMNSLHSNTNPNQHRHTPPTPPPVWEWDQHPPNPTYPIIPNHNDPNAISNSNGYLPNMNQAGLVHSVIDSNSNNNPNTNTNMNGNINVHGIGNANVNGNGNGGAAMDSFFDHGLFGGLTTTLGMGMDGTNGNGNEDDLWTQLFGTFP